VPRFSREQVLEVALRLIESMPPEKFSMHKLGQALGVRPMTLYGYVANKDDVLTGVTQLALAKFHQDVDPDSPWDEQLRAGLREIHSLCREYPHLATLVIARNAHWPELLQIRERMLGILLGAGFDVPTALHALGVLSYYTTGFAGGQASLSTAGAAGTLPKLPRKTFPNLTSVVGKYPEHASEEAFEFGLDLLLTGLRGRLDG
jgi:AcrR family transcriptional regulator